MWAAAQFKLPRGHGVSSGQAPLKTRLAEVRAAVGDGAEKSTW